MAGLIIWPILPVFALTIVIDTRTMSLITQIARRETGLSNTVSKSALKEKLLNKCNDEYLFDDPMVPLLYMKCCDLARVYPFLGTYLIKHFVSSSLSDEETSLVLFVRQWAREFDEYTFLFEEVLGIVDEIRMRDYQLE